MGGVSSTTTGTGITGSLRANATGLPVDAAAPGQPFNYLAFALPAPGQWGNAGRDTIIGPSQFSLNGSMGRTFRLNERKSIDLRFDATNALNHVTFTPVQHHHWKQHPGAAFQSQQHAQPDSHAALPILS